MYFYEKEVADSKYFYFTICANPTKWTMENHSYQIAFVTKTANLGKVAQNVSNIKTYDFLLPILAMHCTLSHSLTHTVTPASSDGLQWWLSTIFCPACMPQSHGRWSLCLDEAGPQKFWLVVGWTSALGGSPCHQFWYYFSLTSLAVTSKL